MPDIIRLIFTEYLIAMYFFIIHMVVNWGRAFEEDEQDSFMFGMALAVEAILLIGYKLHNG